MTGWSILFLVDALFVWADKHETEDYIYTHIHAYVKRYTLNWVCKN